MTAADLPPLTPFFAGDDVTLYLGDCIDVMAQLPECSVDAVVTDPPYGLEFMGQEWDRPWAVGMSKPGYGDADRMARPSFSDSRNANCRTCGGRQRGERRCTCAAPKWDRDPAGDMRAFGVWCTTWAEQCYRLLKPGGHILAFGGTRTWHRLAVAVEDAGFEIRDSMAWLYGSGFPKSLDVSKAIDKGAGAQRDKVRVPASEVRNPKATGGGRDGLQGATRPWIEAAMRDGFHEKDSDEPATQQAAAWQGWGTALKPAFEPIVVGRKPLTGTVAANVLAHGTGALNIGACRIGNDTSRGDRYGEATPGGSAANGWRLTHDTGWKPPAGRWPTNVMLDEDQAAELDRMSGVSHGGTPRDDRGTGGIWSSGDGIPVGPQYGDTGGASRFFYVAKAGRSERPQLDGEGHPTVKPLTLMRWLVRLVTPPGGTVLEPFLGSGTTAQACLGEGRACIGIERDPKYMELVRERIRQDVQLDVFGVAP